jgi:hypothetical protein
MTKLRIQKAMRRLSSTEKVANTPKTEVPVDTGEKHQPEYNRYVLGLEIMDKSGKQPGEIGYGGPTGGQVDWPN